MIETPKMPLPHAVNKIEISKTAIGLRYRQDLGDIDGRANSMQAIGWLHPSVVTPSNTLT
jgi:hypothetical protein